jgi:hypothetical protein
MQSAVSIDRFRSPIAIRVLNKFGAMFNGKVSRRLTPDGLMETASTISATAIFANRLPGYWNRAGETRA